MINRFAFNLVLLLINTTVFAAVINVKDFGAKGNGVANDKIAIQAAIDAAAPNVPTVIYFPAGTYRIASYVLTSNYLENYCLKLRSNITLKGDGTKTVIKLGNHMFDKMDSSANGHMFFGTGLNNVQFQDLLIDMNGSSNLVPKNRIRNQSAIFVMGGKNITIKRITIKNCAGCNMIVIREFGKNAIIEDCKFYNGGNYVGTPVPNKHQFDFSFLYITWDSSIIRNNVLEQQNIRIAFTGNSGGVEMHGSYSEAYGNTITGCSPGFYITSDMYVLKNVLIRDNQMKSCLRGISFWTIHPMENISLENNSIQLKYPKMDVKAGTLTGIEMQNGNYAEYNEKLANAAALNNVRITGNRIFSEMPDETSNRILGLNLHSLQNSLVSDNVITGMNYAGISLQGSKWGMKNLMVTRNQVLNFKKNNQPYADGGYVVITDTYSTTDKKAPGFKNIVIKDNRFGKKDASTPRGKFFGAFVSVPEKMLKEIKMDDNVFNNSNEKVLMRRSD